MNRLEKDLESVPDWPETAYLAKLLSDHFRLVDREHDHRRGIWNDPVCLVCQHIYINSYIYIHTHKNLSKDGRLQNQNAR